MISGSKGMRERERNLLEEETLGGLQLIGHKNKNAQKLFKRFRLFTRRKI